VIRTDEGVFSFCEKKNYQKVENLNKAIKKRRKNKTATTKKFKKSKNKEEEKKSRIK
jgi:hypothetical protein